MLGYYIVLVSIILFLISSVINLFSAIIGLRQIKVVTEDNSKVVRQNIIRVLEENEALKKAQNELNNSKLQYKTCPECWSVELLFNKQEDHASCIHCNWQGHASALLNNRVVK